MTTEQALIKIGVKGADVVLAQMKKIQRVGGGLKKGFLTRLSAVGGSAASAANKTNAQDKKELDNQKNLTKNNEKLANTARSVGDGLVKVAQGAAGLNPTEFIRAIAGAGMQAAATAAGSIPFAGGAAKAAIEYLAKMTDTAISMGSNALTAYKSALPVAAQSYQNQALITQTGYGQYDEHEVMRKHSLQNGEMTVSEASAIAASMFKKFGNMQQGTQFTEKINALFSPDAMGRRVHSEQARAVAGGDFSALGSTKGFLLNQISQSLGNLPPELAQKIQGSLLGQVNREEYISVGEKASSVNVARARMEEADVKQQKAIVGAKDFAVMSNLNNALNGLTVTMVQKTDKLSIALTTAANGLGAFIDSLSDNKKKAEDEIRKNK